jgi:hypothetical protein
LSQGFDTLLRRVDSLGAEINNLSAEINQVNVRLNQLQDWLEEERHHNRGMGDHVMQITAMLAGKQISSVK